MGRKFPAVPDPLNESNCTTNHSLLLIAGTREDRNPNLQVTTTHAQHL